ILLPRRPPTYFCLVPCTTLFRSRGRYVARYVSPEGYAGAVLIPTRVRGRQYLALVDTGASVTAIDRTLAEEWGLAPNLLGRVRRSEEHTSELQSRENIVCRLLL